MTKLSACIEWVFGEDAASFPERIKRAHKSGVEAIEFWHWSNKDLEAIKCALDETGTRAAAVLAEPTIDLTDAKTHAEFLESLPRSIEAAQYLGAPVLIAQSGQMLAHLSEQEQWDNLSAVMQSCADILSASGVKLGLEPLNDKIDHPGYFLTSTKKSLDLVKAINRAEIGIVYDIYHSAIMGEMTEEVIGDDIEHILHVHLADHPGRNEIGSGTIDIAHRVKWLLERGYTAYLGLEFQPKIASDLAVQNLRKIIA